MNGHNIDTLINSNAESELVNGLLLLSRGASIEALRAFESSLRLRPGFPPSARGRIDALMALELYDEAVVAATAACELDRAAPAPHASRAFALFKAGW